MWGIPLGTGLRIFGITYLKFRAAVPQLDFLRIVLLAKRVLQRLVHFFGPATVFRLAAPQVGEKWNTKRRMAQQNIPKKSTCDAVT